MDWILEAYLINKYFSGLHQLDIFSEAKGTGIQVLRKRGVKPNMTDVWHAYGGNAPELPQQNLIAFKVFLQYVGNNKNSTKNVLPKRKFSILDTSPMMLARSDATFDGCHFCLPGPMEFWSRMLYYRIERHGGK